MPSTWLVSPTAATTGGTPLTSPRDSLPLLVSSENDDDLDDYILISTEEESEESNLLHQRDALIAHNNISEESPPENVHIGYGTTVICLRDRRVVVGPRSTKPLRLFSASKSCEHGVRGREKAIHARSAVCSASDVVVEAEEGGLWTFPIDRSTVEYEEVKLREDDTVIVRQLCSERCLKLVAGRDFFVALVAANVTQLGDEDDVASEKETENSSSRHSCLQCQENARLRLSSLMREADKNAEANDEPATNGVRSSTEDRTALMWNGIDHAQSDIGRARAPSMLAISMDEVDDGVASVRAMRGDSPLTIGRARASTDDEGTMRRDWLGRMRRDNTIEMPAKVSVLTWGANSSGQLGQGDNVERSHPQSISFFDTRRVCAIAAGDAHAVALTSSGAAYIWGANVSQSDSKLSLTPTLLKTGESSCVLDVSACGDALAVLVVDDKASMTTSVLLGRRGGGGLNRMMGVSKDHLTTRIRLLPDGRLLLRTIEKENGYCVSVWAECISLCRLLSHLDELGKHCLQERIKQNSTASLDSLVPPSRSSKAKDPSSAKLGTVAAATKLIRKLNRSLARFAMLAAVHSEYVRACLSSLPTVSSPSTVPSTPTESSRCDASTVAEVHQRLRDVMNAPRFRTAFAKFVDAYVTARAYGALEALSFTTDSACRYVDKLSLIYDVASTRSESVVRKLFSLPVEWLRRSVVEFANTASMDTTDSSPSGYASEWLHLLDESTLTIDLATTTATWWRKETNSSLVQSLHRPRRLLVWSGGSWNGVIHEGGLISVVAASAGILSARYTHVLVFSDLIVFATRNSDQRFPTRLVWLSEPEPPTVSGPGSGTKAPVTHHLRVETPDEKFEMEFATKEDRDLFKKRCSLWYWAVYAAEPKITQATVTPVLTSPPLNRKADRFVFAKSGETYTGEWRRAVPHGIGKSTTSSYSYEGSFVDGLTHGEGIMSIPIVDPSSSSTTTSLFYVPSSSMTLMGGSESTKDDAIKDNRKCDVIRGNFEKGHAQGLVHIKGANGCIYRGYVEAAIPQGFGEKLHKDYHYIGFFSKGKPHGYGVYSELNELGTIRRKYLGFFEDGQQHGHGVMMDGCGAYCEGEFRNNQLKSGRLQCPPVEGSEGGHTIEYQGEFNGWRHALGKGTLEVSPSLRITGRFNYAIMGDDGTIKRTEDADILDAKIETKQVVNRLQEMFHGEESLHDQPIDAEANWNWRPLVDLFLKEELGYEGRTRRETTGDQGSDIELTEMSAGVGEGGREGREDEVREAWRQLIERRRRRGGGDKEHGDDDLTHLASTADLRPWSSGYYGMVKNWWIEAMADPTHPFARLSQTFVDIYQASYGSTLGAHRCLHEKAASELRLTLFSIYRAVRVLFPNLPVNPHENVPKELPVGSDETLFSAERIDELDDDTTEEDYDTVSVETATASIKSANDVLPSQPVIDFLYEHFFTCLHPIVLPLYIVSTAEFDDIYWSKIVYLNAHTDVKLLAFLDVPRGIWPIELANPDDLTAAVICNTARNKFYEGAIRMLQNIPTLPNPMQKLRILAETFAAMTACVQAHADDKKSGWVADTLVPAFIYVVVRAGIKHLGAEIRLMEDFTVMEMNGEIGLMFTFLKSAFVYICRQSDVA